MFAKLFTYPNGTQVVLMRQETPEGDPEVRAAFDSLDPALGVCGASVIFPRATSDDPDGAADACFEGHTAHTARGWADDVLRKISRLV